MEKDLTYKVKCRNCGKITEMYLGDTSQFTEQQFRVWAAEHSTFPFHVQCKCDNGSIMLHDLVSYTVVF